MKKPTNIYGKVLYYERCKKIAIETCREQGIKPTLENIISIMGDDYFDMLRTNADFKNFKSEEKLAKKRKKKRIRRRLP